ncbi:MAG TPA: hypothetical protein VM783_10680 [Candidatus Acidoferrum sp.]|nr:hypothetical protein [Candidatus Acidoferrum sp.]
MPVKSIQVIGFDPSMNNWGVSKGVITVDTVDFKQSFLKVNHLQVIQPVKPEGKQVRNNSKDLLAAEQLARHAMAAAQGTQAIFVEVPHGSQSARAMASYGVCIGVLGALRAMGIPFFEVSAMEVKIASSGNKTASKLDQIEWAMQQHPEAPWPMFTNNGKQQVSQAKAEHMADATAAIYAGVRTPAFQQLLALLLGQP